MGIVGKCKAKYEKWRTVKELKEQLDSTQKAFDDMKKVAEAARILYLYYKAVDPESSNALEMRNKRYHLKQKALSIGATYVRLKEEFALNA